ncbi:Pc13g10860 [Penicillium rubens Wisconsin 54-1255]|uniref:Pc13g10860 protein n=1 Tax=Penicillium rubens (strain ATCC 28089 / DSM 1075 / NRRL 1951 / Wisconsin 54-1255) TaxID=500485 RepID=B6H3V7_PENRW|nr:Pc13g10860 [Penicillium rubens Wisconsin 54-1255]
MEAQEQALRNHPDDDFTYGVGRFWKILPTRPYMNARLDYRAALTFVCNVESVQAQLDTLMENLRLCRGDNIGSRDLVPGLMIRLDRDQECYDFLKWWATSAKDPKYNWADPTLAIPGHQKCQSAYEEASENLRKTMDGMMGLRNSNMARNPHIANMTSLEAAPAIQELKAQIRQLYHTVNKANPYFWPETIKPDETLNAVPSMYMAGSKEEMQATMMWIWNACHETFGALQIIHGALNHPNDEFPL